MRPRPRGRALLLWLVVVALAAAVDGSAARPFSARAAEVVISVTSADDPIDTGMSECPSDAACTLRQAITVANDDAGVDPVVIEFDHDVFPVDEPATIAVQGSPLPPISRADVTVDGRGAGVQLDGALLTPGADVAGLTLAGEASTAVGLSIHDFSAACVVASGNGAIVGGSSAEARNTLDDCATGVFVSGMNAEVRGNLVGLAPGGDEVNVMNTGILLTGASAKVGTLAPQFDQANVVGNVAVAIQVGRGSGEEFGDTVIRGNRLGITLAGGSVPVGTAVLIDHPSSASTVGGNLIAYAGTGIAVAPDSPDHSSDGNDLRGNEYQSLAGLAIDLLADGLRNPNDPGDADHGPNSLLNSPEFAEVSQAGISGTACEGCIVDLYGVDHAPGAAADHPLAPIPGGNVTAGNNGTFSIPNPQVSVGSWIMAIATDPGGNTSEFSTSERVGAGIVQCGNVEIKPGWNLVGYFGQPALLGGQLPGDDVSVVHQLNPGSTDYLSWYPDMPLGLVSLTTGEPYWFYGTGPASLPGGISLTTGLPVHLDEGWNDFVYVGGAADVLDALESIDGAWDALYRYDNSSSGSPGWRSYGSPGTPSYVHAFDNLHACTAYRIHMTEATTLIPLRP